LAALVAAGPTGVKAESERQPIACGSPYTVVSGDSLYEIAIRAYGSGPRFEAIYAANRSLLQDARKLSIGDKIEVPCLDAAAPEPGPGPLAADAAIVAGPAVSVPPDSPSAAEPVTLLVHPSFGRLAGRDLPGGGLIADLSRRAIGQAAPGEQVETAFIDDRGSLLGRLMRDGTAQAGLPWFKPDCAADRSSSREVAILCDRFVFSEPLFEVPVAIYAATKRPADATGLAGKRLCQPLSQSFSLGVEPAGASAPVVGRAGTTAACFVRLIRGQTDLVMAPRAEAEAEIGKLEIADAVAEVEGLATMRGVHAIAAKDSPDGLASLARINSGLAKLLASGEWFRIVVEHQSQKVATRE